jgi:mannose-6-phosphate isomerase-like protein (cupin superfamily)
MQTDFLQTSQLEESQKKSGKRYFEFLRVSAMSAGMYTLAAGATDQQSPHKEDELYYVVRGKARMKAGNEDHPVAPGAVIFVAAGVEHRFYDIEIELSVLVFFAPAES